MWQQRTPFVQGDQDAVYIQDHDVTQVGVSDPASPATAPASSRGDGVLPRANSIRFHAAGSARPVRAAPSAPMPPGPAPCPWRRSTLMFAIVLPPSASITATSAITLPRSCTGWKEHRAVAFDS